MHRYTAIPSLCVVAALCFTGAAGSARATAPHGARTPQQVVAHHFAMIAAGDLDALVNDYTDDAVVITAAGVTRGKAAIRAQFAQLLRPAAAAPGASGAVAPRAGPDIIEKHFAGDVAWLMWVRNAGKANEMRGVETYLVRDGRIRLETVGTVNVHPAAATSAAQQ
jgi:ketosteroid isomerase-like protein